MKFESLIFDYFEFGTAVRLIVAGLKGFAAALAFIPQTAFVNTLADEEVHSCFGTGF